MINSLFDRKLTKKFDSIARQKANIQKEENDLCKEFMSKIKCETILCILDTVEKNGHPNEKNISRNLRNKYEQETLSFDDIIVLNNLYKSNYRNINNKGD